MKKESSGPFPLAGLPPFAGLGLLLFARLWPSPSASDASSCLPLLLADEVSRTLAAGPGRASLLSAQAHTRSHPTDHGLEFGLQKGSLRRVHKLNVAVPRWHQNESCAEWSVVHCACLHHGDRQLAESIFNSVAVLPDYRLTTETFGTDLQSLPGKQQLLP